LVEKPVAENQAIEVLDIAQKFFGKKAYALMSLEVGSLCSFLPVTVAAAKNLHLVDSDTMGRPFQSFRLHLLL
jgi:DUF917 family protein